MGAAVCQTSRGFVDSPPSMGIGRDKERLLQPRIGNFWKGKIMTEEGTSSSPYSHSSKGSPHIAIPSPQIQVSQDSMNSLQQKNIDDILKQREWEVKNVRNWLDGEGEEFFRDYNDLPLPPTKGPQLREREPAQHPPLRKLLHHQNPKKEVKIIGRKKRQME